MHTMIGRLAAVAALALVLAACGSGSTASQQPTSRSSTEHSTAVATAVPAATTAVGNNTDHSPTLHNSTPYDAMFIDSMTLHHQGAIDMANQAIREAQKPEIKTLAQAIIKAQEGEITKMRQWRQAWYPGLPETGGMDMGMGQMMISGSTSKPFDQRFIEAMIPHHEGAIAMAKDAQQKAEHTEIKTLAQTIITTQEGEIAQLRRWLQAWFPN